MPFLRLAINCASSVIVSSLLVPGNVKPNPRVEGHLSSYKKNLWTACRGPRARPGIVQVFWLAMSGEVKIIIIMKVGRYLRLAGILRVS